MNDNNSQVQEDFASFSAPDPKVAAANRKKQEAAEKKEADLQKRLKPEQLKAASKLTEKMKDENEAVIKADLIQKLTDYMKLIKEYHPERLQWLKIPSTFGAKTSIEQLRIWIRDCQTELGKKGGLDFAMILWKEGFKQLENVSERTGLADLEGLGRVAELSITPRRMPDGEIVPGPATPTLAEFCVYHSAWFSTSVNMRMALLVGNMVQEVHRMNTQRKEGAPDVSQKPASEKSKSKVKDL